MNREEENEGVDLSIKPIKNNSKDKIEQPSLSKKDVIPRINTSNLFIGGTGMGKTTLIANLVTKKQFFGGTRKDGSPWFDNIILISPTGDSDEIQKSLGVNDEKSLKVLTDMDTVPQFLEVLMREQKKIIKEKGADQAPFDLIVYDDVISNPKLMRNKQFLKSFIANRHHNFTVFLGAQSWTKVPRAARLQTRGIFYFAGGMSEVELLADEYCPPGLNKHDFLELVEYATRVNYDFLYINKSVGVAKRFRRNLTEILQSDYFKGSKKNPDFSLPPLEEKKDTNEKSELEDSEETATSNSKTEGKALDKLYSRKKIEKKNTPQVVNTKHSGYTSKKRLNHKDSLYFTGLDKRIKYGGKSKHGGRGDEDDESGDEVRNKFRPKRLKSHYRS